MPTTRGKLVSAIVSDARIDLQDTSGAPRWSDATILSSINDAINLLAQGLVFRRTDVLVPTAGRSTYVPHLESVSVASVSYGGAKLEARTRTELERILGQSWSTQTGDPSYYVPGDTLRIAPVPGAGGTTPTFSTPELSEADGKGPSGHGYWCADNAGTLVHFLPGDGVVTNYETGNLWVEYAYYPGPVTPTLYIPSRIALACRIYAVGQCLEASEDPGEQQRRQISLQRFEALRDDLVSGYNSADYLPMAGYNAEGWERGGGWNALNGY